MSDSGVREEGRPIQHAQARSSSQASHPFSRASNPKCSLCGKRIRKHSREELKVCYEKWKATGVFDGIERKP